MQNITLYLLPPGHNLCDWMRAVTWADISEALIIPDILLRKKAAGWRATSAKTKSRWEENE